MNAIPFLRTVEPVRDEEDLWQVLTAVTLILTRCDDLDAQASPDSVLSREQIGRDSRRIREKAMEIRSLLAARVR